MPRIDINALHQKLFDFLTAKSSFTQNKSSDEVFASAARDSSVNSEVFDSRGFRGVRLFLDITATAGTPTLDLKVQVYDSVSEKYVDLDGAEFAQQTSTGTATLTIYPGIAETANESVSDVIGSQFRVVATIGGTTPSFTFTLNADYIK